MVGWLVGECIHHDRVSDHHDNHPPLLCQVSGSRVWDMKAGEERSTSTKEMENSSSRRHWPCPQKIGDTKSETCDLSQVQTL